MKEIKIVIKISIFFSLRKATLAQTVFFKDFKSTPEWRGVMCSFQEQEITSTFLSWLFLFSLQTQVRLGSQHQNSFWNQV